MTDLVPFASPRSARIYLYNLPVDMRRSFDGLMAIVQAEFQQDVRQGDLFLFINKRCDRIKMLWWDDDGLAIFMKRLEQGTFERPWSEASQPRVELDRTALSLLLSGIELNSVNRRKRYRAELTATAADARSREEKTFE